MLTRPRFGELRRPDVSRLLPSMDVRTCLACSLAVDESGRFCPECGAVLAEAAVATVPPPAAGSAQGSAAGSLVGQTVDGFAIESVIGGGAFGTVYRGRQLGLDRVVAIKVPTHEIASDPVMSRRFAREAKAAARVHHPGVVSIYQVGEIPDGRPYMAMQLVEGEPLDVIIEDGPVPVPRALRLARQIASALAECHACNVVHRDLKPTNVMWRRDRAGDDRITLVDFGIAVCRPGPNSDVTRLTGGGLIGTPHYMSPEQAHGEVVDARADLYALGCLLFELLTATTPFSGSGFEVLLAHLGRPAPKPSERVADLPEVVDDLVGKLMAKRPADRAQTADAVVEMIDEALDVLDAPRSQITKLVTPPRARRKTAKTANDRPAVRAVGYTTNELEPVSELAARPHRARWAAFGAVVALALAGGGFAAFRYISGSDATAASSPQIDQSTNNHAAEVPKVFRDEGDVRLKVWWRDDAVTASRPLRMALDLRNKLNRPLGAESIVVIVEDPSGKSIGITARPRQAVPEQYSATIRFTGPGRYTVKIFAPETPSSFDFPIDVK
jgi:serine/threonine protein kinase